MIAQPLGMECDVPVLVPMLSSSYRLHAAAEHQPRRLAGIVPGSRLARAVGLRLRKLAARWVWQRLLA